jgi:hypothetical protein
MGFLENLFRVLSGKQKNHIDVDNEIHRGFATGKDIQIKRIEPTVKYEEMLKALFEEKQDYLFFATLQEVDKRIAVRDYALSSVKDTEASPGNHLVFGATELSRPL